MYIENGIVYGGEKKIPLKVCGVRPMKNHRLWVRFNTGEAKVFNFEPLLDTPCFKPLSDESTFNGVYIDYGCTVWNDGSIDIAPEYLYENGEISE